jgi:ribonuclease P protein subunit POP4
MATPTPSKPHIAADLLARAHPPEIASRIFTEKVKLRPLHLKPSDDVHPNARAYRRAVRLRAEETAKKRRKPKPLTAREKRATGIYDIPKEQRKYAIFKPLNKLWLGYIHEVLGDGRPVAPGIAAKLVSADYHGAEMEVVRSRCVSRVGVKGIVTKDTKFTFEIITLHDELKIIPKEHTVFRIHVPELNSKAEEGKQGGQSMEAVTKKKNLIFELHGDQFQHRSVDRANKKFKPHFLPDL